MRRNIGLAAGSPGTMARLAAVSTSNRRVVLRLPGSGPWQVKQLSDRMGRMSRLNSTSAASDGMAARKRTTGNFMAQEIVLVYSYAMRGKRTFHATEALSLYILVLTSTWRTHSCVQCRHSCRHGVRPQQVE